MDQNHFPEGIHSGYECFAMKLLNKNFKIYVTIIVQFQFSQFFSQIFERIIHKRLYHFLTRNSLFHSSQFGFRKNLSSSCMAVLEAYNNIVSHLEKGEHTAGI